MKGKGTKEKLMARGKAQSGSSCSNILGKAVCDRIVRLREKGFSIWRIAVYTSTSEYYVRKVLRERGMMGKRKGA
jgi:hypothetical protein